MFEDSGNEQVAVAMSQKMEITLDAEKDMFMKIWIFTHSIAAMLAVNNISLSESGI